MAGQKKNLMKNGLIDLKQKKSRTMQKKQNKLKIMVIKFMKSEIKGRKERDKDEEIILFINLDNKEWS